LAPARPAPEPTPAATEIAEEPAQAEATVAREIQARPAPGVPLPPDRPFDLGQAGRAAAAAKAAPMPPPRTVMRGSITTASMFAAPEEPGVVSVFRRDDPLAGLIEQNFVPLRRQAASL
jgi:hypothetical protein